MGLENPPLDAVRSLFRAAALASALAAAGCIISPLDDITPSTESKPSDVKGMDAGSDAAESDASRTAPDAGAPESQDGGSSEPEKPPTSNTAGRAAGGRAGTGGRGGSSGSVAGSSGAGGGGGSGGEAPTAGAAGSNMMMTPETTNKAIEEATRQYFERINQRTEVRCDCFEAPEAEASCTWYQPRKPHVDCMTDAFQRVGADMLEPLRCATDVEQQWGRCYEQAGCTEESFVACNETNLHARAACQLIPNDFVDRCLGVYDGITGVDGFMQRASQFVEHICRCNPDGTIDPTTTCSDTWHADTSTRTIDCVADSVYGIEARSLDQESSPAIAVLQCVNAALGAYAQCMDERAATCDPAAQEQCSDSFTTRVGDECGAQGIGLFTCISPM